MQPINAENNHMIDLGPFVSHAHTHYSSECCHATTARSKLLLLPTHFMKIILGYFALKRPF